MKEKGRLFYLATGIRGAAALFLALLFLTLSASACMPADAPVLALTRELTVYLEGQPEHFRARVYRGPSYYALWYDDSNFSPEEGEHGVRFPLKDNQLGSEVYFEVAEVSFSGPQQQTPSLQEIQEQYEKDGWTAEKLDTRDMLPSFQFGIPQEPVLGFLASRGEERAQVYLTSVASGTYLCTLRYPIEAAEGWGARMLAMLNTLETLPGE